MGRFMMMICLTLISVVACKAQQRGYIGVDVAAGIIGQTAGIVASHSFAKKWTADAAVSLTSSIKRNNENEESRHKAEFEKEDDTGSDSCAEDSDKTFMKTGISVSFWQKETYHGSFLNFGIETDGRDTPRFKIGAGYMLHIWKGITADLMYSISLNTKEIQQQPLQQGISLCIGYVF